MSHRKPRPTSHWPPDPDGGPHPGPVATCPICRPRLHRIRANTLEHQ